MGGTSGTGVWGKETIDLKSNYLTNSSVCRGATSRAGIVYVRDISSDAELDPTSCLAGPRCCSPLTIYAGVGFLYPASRRGGVGDEVMPVPLSECRGLIFTELKGQREQRSKMHNAA